MPTLSRTTGNWGQQNHLAELRGKRLKRNHMRLEALRQEKPDDSERETWKKPVTESCATDLGMSVFIFGMILK